MLHWEKQELCLKFNKGYPMTVQLETVKRPTACLVCNVTVWSELHQDYCETCGQRVNRIKQANAERQAKREQISKLNANRQAIEQQLKQKQEKVVNLTASDQTEQVDDEWTNAS